MVIEDCRSSATNNYIIALLSELKSFKHSNEKIILKKAMQIAYRMLIVVATISCREQIISLCPILLAEDNYKINGKKIWKILCWNPCRTVLYWSRCTIVLYIYYIVLGCTGGWCTMIQHTGTAAINLYLLHCDAELRTEGQTRADQATISISDGGNVCQAYTNNKMGKNNH